MELANDTAKRQSYRRVVAIPSPETIIDEEDKVMIGLTKSLTLDEAKKVLYRRVWRSNPDSGKAIINFIYDDEEAHIYLDDGSELWLFVTVEGKLDGILIVPIGIE
jgi:hypothetical protein